MALNLRLYDSSKEMFAALPREQTIVAPSATVRAHLLYRLSRKTFFTPVITLYDLFQKTAEEVSGLPGALLPVQTQGHIAGLLKSEDFPPQLRALRGSPAGLDALVAHLREIDERADRDYLPTNDLEEGIALLRRRLAESGQVPKSFLQSLTARQAKEVVLPEAPLTVLPRGQLSPMAAGLLKGLAVNNDIDLYFLVSEVSAELLLKQGRFDQYEKHFTNTPLSERSWTEEHNQAEAIVDIISAWIKDGEDNIGIVIDPQGGLSEQLETEAATRGVPLMVSTRVTARTSPLGTLLLSLAEEFEASQAIAASIDLSQEQAEALTDAMLAGDGLAGLVTLGEEMLCEKDPYLLEYGRDYEWLFQLKDESLQESVADLSLSKVISLVRSRRALRGRSSYPTVVSYADAGACLFNRVVYASLDRYPPRAVLSPFVSEELITSCPLLRASDLRGEFSGALRAARKEIAFVAVKDSPAPYWGLTYEGEVELPAPPRIKSDKRIRQDQARDLLTEARLRRGDFASERSVFSVSQLEQFDTCPAGWFVKYVLRPDLPSGTAAQMGTIAHEILAEALDENDLDQIIEDKFKGRNLDESQRRVIEDRVRATMAVYSPPVWPLPFYKSELNLSATGLVEAYPEVVIKGIADRLDGSPEQGFLLLDYKFGRRPLKGKSDGFQQILYPLMVESQLDSEALGLLYVSLRFQDHDGLLKRGIKGVSDDYVRYGFDKESGKALARIDQAITRIHEGDIFTIGGNCQDWCPHHHLSQTTREVFQ